MHKEQLEKFYEALKRQYKELFGVELQKEVVKGSILMRKVELERKFREERLSSLSYQDLVLLGEVVDDGIQSGEARKTDEQPSIANAGTCGNEKALCCGGKCVSNCQGSKPGQEHSCKVSQAVHKLDTSKGEGSRAGSDAKDKGNHSGKRSKGK